MKEELQGLLLQAKQMEAEQKAKLTPIERSEDFEMEFDGFLGFTVRGRLVR